MDDVKKLNLNLLCLENLVNDLSVDTRIKFLSNRENKLLSKYIPCKMFTFIIKCKDYESVKEVYFSFTYLLRNNIITISNELSLGKIYPDNIIINNNNGLIEFNIVFKYFKNYILEDLHD